MDIIEDIEALWQTNVAQPLVPVLKKLNEFLDNARQSSISIPLNLEIDIILASNNAFGFGGQLSEAEVLFNLMHRVMNEAHRLSSTIVSRLGCTMSGTYLSHLTSDMHNNTLNVLLLTKKFGIVEDEIGPQLVGMIKMMLKLLSTNKLDFWSLELSSFIITFYSLLSQISVKLLPTQLIEENLKPLFDQDRTPEIERWRSEWVEKTDYFRFISLFMINKHPQEDLWQKYASHLTGIS